MASEHAPDAFTADETIDCALCIVGAGIAGLNALHSASRYLAPGDRVVLVDAGDEPGGMWNETYDFVRLHQPHALFTVGDIPWARKMPRQHLADRQEVGEQFRHCLDELRQRVQLTTLFGHGYEHHVEQDAGVEMVCTRRLDDRRVRIRAPRLIKAFGLNVRPSAPLELSSTRVRSLTPHSPELAAYGRPGEDAPIIIVGGGKTAMDTALHVLRKHPGRELRMLIGHGVAFFNRDVLFPQGWRRWFGGAPMFEAFLDIARQFDGTNAQNCVDYLVRHYGLALNERPRQFQVGIVSAAELAEVRRGVSRIVEDHLVDVVDGATGPQLELRRGAAMPVPAGSWVINCTGYLTPPVPVAAEPMLSASGRVLSINQTAAAFFLGSFGGYFLTHLFFRGQLAQLPLYLANADQILREHKDELGILALAQTVHNVIAVMQALPLGVINQCRLDYNLWYPLPRRLPIQLRFLLNGRAYQAHCRQALDRARESRGLPIDIAAGLLSDTRPRVGRAVAA